MHLYKADIKEFSQYEIKKEYSLLDMVTRNRVDCMTNDKRTQTIIGRILLRRAILEIYGIESYDIEYNHNGKPLLDFCFFSISHSKTRVVCVVSDNPIGVDIEFIKQIKSSSHYPLFSKAETKDINEHENTSLRFLELWTRKEAFVKINGGKIIDVVDTLNFDFKNFVFTTEIVDDCIITVCESTIKTIN